MDLGPSQRSALSRFGIDKCVYVIRISANRVDFRTEPPLGLEARTLHPKMPLRIHKGS